jgi:hypothetical protein
MSRTRTTGSGIGFGSLLLLTFIILKLCGVIGWSWVWVLSPLWIVVGFVLLVAILQVAAEAAEERRCRRDPNYAVQRELRRYEQRLMERFRR